MKHIVLFSGSIISCQFHVFSQESFTAEYLPEFLYETGLTDLLVHPDGKISMLISDESIITAKGRICRLDEAGFLLDCSAYDLNGNARINSWAGNSDQEIFLAYHNSSLSSAPNHFVAKLNQGGDVVWSRKVQMNIDFNLYSISSVSASINGGVFVNLISSMVSSPAVYMQTIMLLDADGELQWSYSKGDQDGIESIMPKLSLVSEEGEFYAASLISDGVSNSSKVLLTGMSAEGVLLWNKVLTLVSSHQLLDLKISPEGTFWILTGQNGVGFIHQFTQVGAHISSYEIFQTDGTDYSFFPIQLGFGPSQIYLFGEFANGEFVKPALARLSQDIVLEEITFSSLPESRRFVKGILHNNRAYIGFGTVQSIGSGVLSILLNGGDAGCFENITVGQGGIKVEVVEGGDLDALSVDIELLEVGLERSEFDVTQEHLCIPASLSERALKNFRVYPNPTNGDVLHISGIPDIASITVELWDIHGRLVSSSQGVIGPEYNLQLPEFLDAGMYLLRLNELSVSRKILISGR